MLSLLVTVSLLLLIPIALILLRAGASTAAATMVTAVPGTAAPSMTTMDTADAGIGAAPCCIRFLAKFLVVATSSPRIARKRHPPTPRGRRIPRTGLVPNDAGRSGGSWLGGRGGEGRSCSRRIACSSRTTTFGIIMRRWHSRHWHDARHRDVRQERRRAGIDRVDGHRDAAGHGVVSVGLA